jgi:hypothetical protein
MYFILFSFVLFLLCWSVYDEGLYADLAAGLRAYRENMPSVCAILHERRARI